MCIKLNQYLFLVENKDSPDDHDIVEVIADFKIQFTD